jgi:DNA-binding CsgD family transcriptional regulator
MFIMSIKDRPHRSDHYQYLWREIPWDFTPSSTSHHEATIEMGNDRALYQPSQHSSQFLELNERALQAIQRVASQCLTERQLQVYQMTCQGLTQWEIADKLGVHQSSVQKSLNGNREYANGTRGKMFGGIGKKLIAALLQDEQFRSILYHMFELEEE